MNHKPNIIVKAQKPTRDELYRLSETARVCRRTAALTTRGITVAREAARNREVWRADRKGRLLPPRKDWPCLGRVMSVEAVEEELTWRDIRV